MITTSEIGKNRSLAGFYVSRKNGVDMTKRDRFPMAETKKMAVGGLLIAVGILLPQVFHLAGGSAMGTLFLPMHLPVLLGGFLLGPLFGGTVGPVSYTHLDVYKRQAMTLANDGVRYKTHLVHSVRSYDGLTDTVVQPEVVSRADLSKEAIDTVRKGMVEVVKSGTASRFFNKGNLPYTLAAKTGTGQIVEGKTDVYKRQIYGLIAKYIK